MYQHVQVPKMEVLTYVTSRQQLHLLTPNQPMTMLTSGTSQPLDPPKNPAKTPSGPRHPTTVNNQRNL